MNKEQIKIVVDTYNEVVMTQYLDKERIFEAYKIINDGIETQNLNIAKRCIISFVVNHVVEEPEPEPIKINKTKRNGKKI